MLGHVFLQKRLVAAGNHVDAEFTEIDRVVLTDTEPSRDTVAVGDYEIDALLLANVRQ